MKPAILVLASYILFPLLALAESTSPQDAIESYVDACSTGDVSQLESLFHPNALMSGFYEGEFYLGSPDPFFDEIRDNPRLSEAEVAYVGRITDVSVSGDIASVTLVEDGYFGESFTNLFQLARLGGSWKIISKAYVEN